MNWGDNLTLIGAMRSDRWLTLGTVWRGVTYASFEEWVRTRLAPTATWGRRPARQPERAQVADRPAVDRSVRRNAAVPAALSHDFNPIEPAWGLIKKRIRKHGPRTATALRRIACAARHVVRPRHCRQWFRHAGYANSSAHRD